MHLSQPRSMHARHVVATIFYQNEYIKNEARQMGESVYVNHFSYVWIENVCILLLKNSLTVRYSVIIISFFFVLYHVGR